MEFDFDEIRPFYDHEVQSALSRLGKESGFEAALAYVFPELGPSELKDVIQSIHSVSDFQTKIVAGAVERIADFTTSGLEVSGLEKLDPNKAYLFISNHRDIVLDSAFINYILHRERYPTTRIAIGNNLLQKEWITDLVKLNKNFIVHRNVASRQAYDYSMRLSQYIRHSLHIDQSSVWIAQREGRAKDGIDNTQSGLLKMFAMAYDSAPEEAFKSMRIIPVSLSYEKEPCGGLKAREMYMKARDGKYVKQDGEDLVSMQTGISASKGKVHIHFGEQLSDEIIHTCFEGVNKNEGFKNLAEAIDKKINAGYKLNAYNFIAADLLEASNRFVSHYSENQKIRFEKELEKELSALGDVNIHEVKPFFLNIYANPVFRKINFNLAI